MKKLKCCSICCFVTGVLFVILGIILIIIIPIIVKNTVDKEVPLYDGSFADQQWTTPPYAIYFDIWLFNVTNPDEILHRGAKPSLRQQGPYSFIEKQRKINVIRNESESTITYKNLKDYTFNQATSCDTCRESDMFVVPNVPYFTAINLLNTQPNISTEIKTIINLALMAIGEHPFVFKNSKQLLFQGYDDQLFSLISLVKKFIPTLGGTIPDKMGFFYPKNVSCDGVYVIDSGEDNVDNVGNILLWNGNDTLAYWHGHQANMINGSDGSLYAPYVTKSTILRMFVSDICRSIYATYYGEVEVEGIKGYRFVIPESAFDARNPDNFGFCQATDQTFYKDQIPIPDTNLTCLPSGFLNMSSCQFGAPVVITSPNFLYCPQEVFETVTGISQPGFNDVSTIDLEPTTGVLMNVERKIQINVAMYRYSNYPMLKYLTPVIIPVLFLNESAHISPSMRDYLYKNVVLTQNVFYGLTYAILALGGLLVVAIGVAFLVLRYRRPLCFSGDKYADGEFEDASRSHSTYEQSYVVDEA